MTIEAGTDSKTKIAVNTTVTPPKQYKVLYLNDDKTTVDFVVDSLVAVFDYTKEKGFETAMVIDQQGSAVVAVLPYEIAEQKGIEVTMLARNNGFPLQVRLEVEE